MAVNVAYLNLRRFRYRDRVRDSARNHVKELRGAKIDDLSQTKALKQLAGEDVSCVDLPAAVKAFLAIYGRELDMKAAIAFSVFSAFILSAGVATNINIWSATGWIGTQGWVASYFYLLLVSLAVPAVAVFAGRRLSVTVTDYADRCSTQISSTYDEQVKDAKVPEMPANTAPPTRLVRRQVARFPAVD